MDFYVKPPARSFADVADTLADSRFRGYIFLFFAHYISRYIIIILRDKNRANPRLCLNYYQKYHNDIIKNAVF